MKKNFQDEELPHRLFLTTGQKTKIRNTFANNMSADMNLSKAQLSKTTQSEGFNGALLGKLAGPSMKVGALTPIATLALASAIDRAIKKFCGRGVLRAEKTSF